MSTTQKDDHADVLPPLLPTQITGAWLSALHAIANANLKRCSAGWLQRIARDALIATGQRTNDDPAKSPL